MLKHPILLFSILLTAVLFLQYRLWFDSDGLIHMMRLKKQLDTATLTNEQLKKRNELLHQEVKSLQKNKDAVEYRARQELGMIKKDETFYQIVK